MLITVYKEHEIHYEPGIQQFRTEDKWFPTQAEAEKYIDRIDKAEKQKFEPIPAILKGSWSGNIITGKITSIIDDKEAWFMSDAGKRKVELKEIYQATEENLKRVAGFEEITKQISALDTERSRIKFDSPVQAPVIKQGGG